MTIILTKPVRVGGVELAAATTQTFSADVEADLISRGAATPVFLAPGAVAPGANHIAEHRALGGVANQIAAIGTPFAILPGDGAAVGMFFTGTAGAFTLTGAAILTNLWNLLKGCWCYLPANFGGKTYPARWYWAVFSSDTAGILYNNVYSSGVPARPSELTPFADNLAGWLTQTTSEVTGPTGFVLPGGSMGPSGNIKIHARGSGNITSTKSFRHYLGSTVIFYTVPTTSPSYEFLVVTANQGSESLQSNARVSAVTGVGQNASVCAAAEASSINTSADQPYSVSLQISTTSGCAVLLHSDVTATYGA